MATQRKHHHTVIIGSGQSGLSTGYYLKKNNIDFVILDENERTGDSWRKRWDSLKLFTPAQYDGLPGMPFPGEKNSFPAKNSVALYLEAYARKFDLPVKNGVKVTSLSHSDGLFSIDTSAGKFTADNVVIATGTHPLPKVPLFAGELSKEIFQIHSSDYQNPEQLPEGDVLVVGAGVSGVEIALEVSATRNTYIAGEPTFHIPDNVFKYFGRMYWWLVYSLITVKTPVGKKARSRVLHGGGPLIGVSADDLDKAGIERLSRVTGVQHGFPEMEDGRIVRVSSIIWCTGFKPDFSWCMSDVTDETGWPRTDRGISLSYKGLFFMGMPFQFGLTSGLLGGVGRDAAFIAKHIS